MMDIFAKNLTVKSFLQLIAPATISMVFISSYTIVDGLFVGNFIGENALAAVNIIFPLLNFIFGFSVMFGSGGSALIGILMGGDKIQEAREGFSLITAVGIITGVVLTSFFIAIMEDLVIWLGASPVLFQDCYEYGIIIALTAPFIIQNDVLEIFLRTDGKAVYSLWLAFLAGALNIFFDYLFIVEMKMGLAGSAWALAISFAIPCMISTAYFWFKKTNLYFVKPKMRFNVIWHTCYNGMSEMVTRLSSGYVTFLFNLMTMRYLGEAGVAAISIILYIHFLMISIYLGFSFGCSPLISYNFGAGDKKQLKTAIDYSCKFLFVSAIVVFTSAMLFAPYIVGAFVDKSTHVFELATNGLRFYAICFLFIGFNIFISAMFTAFANGRISALIAATHSFIFVSIGIVILPWLFGTNGIWLTVPVAEVLTLGLSYYCFKLYKNVYGY